jgi:hypothetical protein
VAGITVVTFMPELGDLDARPQRGAIAHLGTTMLDAQFPGVHG